VPEKWHLETKYRWVKQYNFYIRMPNGTDVRSGMSVLSFLYPDLSESAPLLAQEDEAAGIRFTQTGTPFAAVAIPRLSRIG